MRSRNPRTAIATRTVELSIGKINKILKISIYRPVRNKGGEHRCDYSIAIGTAIVAKSAALGEDSMQSLLLAVSIIDREIERIINGYGAKIDHRELADIRRQRLA